MVKFFKEQISTSGASNGDILRVDGSGDYTFISNSLSNLLSVGNTSGGNDIALDSGDSLNTSGSHNLLLKRNSTNVLSLSTSTADFHNLRLVNLTDPSSAQDAATKNYVDTLNVTGLSGELSDPQKVTVRKNTGSNIGSQPRLNFIEGSNITLSISNDSGNNEIDLTISSSGGGGGGGSQTLSQTLDLGNTTDGYDIEITGDVINWSSGEIDIQNSGVSRFLTNSASTVVNTDSGGFINFNLNSTTTSYIFNDTGGSGLYGLGFAALNGFDVAATVVQASSGNDGNHFGILAGRGGTGTTQGGSVYLQPGDGNSGGSDGYIQLRNAAGGLVLSTDNNINANSNKIINVIDPTNPQDAATKAYVDANSGDSGGESLSETLDLGNTTDGYSVIVSSGDHIEFGSNPAQTGVIRLSNNESIVGRNVPDSADISLIKVDNSNNIEIGQSASFQKIEILSGTGVDLFVTSVAELSVNSSQIDVVSKPIVNVTDPTNPQDAATKAYVDANIGPSGGESLSETLDIGNTTDGYDIELSSGDSLNTSGDHDLVLKRNDVAVVTFDGSSADFSANNINTTSYLRVGSSPASQGAIRLTNAEAIYSRNAADNGNLNVIRADSSDVIVIGDASGGGTVFYRTNSDHRFQNGAGNTDLLTINTTSINAHSKPIVSVTDPTSPQDAATKAYVDATVTTDDQTLTEVLTSGNTTGGTDIDVTSGDGVNFAGEVDITRQTIKVLDTNGSATTRIYAAGSVAASINGTAWDFQSLSLENVTDPTNPQDAATKAYVDANAGLGGEETLAETLGFGNITDGYDIDVSAGDAIDFLSDINIQSAGVTKIQTSGSDTILHASSPNVVQMQIDSGVISNFYDDTAGSGLYGMSYRAIATGTAVVYVNTVGSTVDGIDLLMKAGNGGSGGSTSGGDLLLRPGNADGGTDGVVLIQDPSANTELSISNGTIDAQNNSIVTTGNIQIGSAPATTGGIRLGNAQALIWRNNANDGDIQALTVGGADGITFGDDTDVAQIFYETAGSHQFEVGGTLQLLINGSTLNAQDNSIVTTGNIQIGSTPATTGEIRINNGGSIIARNNANDGNIGVIDVSSSDIITVGGGTTASAVFLDAVNIHRFRIASNDQLTISNTQVDAQDNSILTTANIIIGTSPSTDTTADIRVDNGTTIISARNASDDNDFDVLATTNDGYIDISDTTNVIFEVRSEGLFVADTSTPDIPIDGHAIYSESGALKGKGSSGTITTMAPSEPHCPRCGRDAALEWENPDQKWKLSICMYCLTDGFSAQESVIEKYQN